MKSKIEILEYLRFVSLVEVFLIHYFNDYLNAGLLSNFLMVSGKLGVAVFFMITAYLLVITSKPDKKGNIKKKIHQLIPKYEIILFLVFIASLFAPKLFKTFNTNIWNFVKSVFLIPYTTEGVPFSCPMLPVAWTLIVQFFIFICFYSILYFIKKIDYTGIIMVIICVFLGLLKNISSIDNVFTYTYCRFYMLYFATGFFVGILDRRLSSKSSYKNREGMVPSIYIFIGLVIFLLISCLYEENTFWYLLISCLFGICMMFLKNLKFPKFILFYGKISYSFFLIHYLLCKVFTRIFVNSNMLIMASVCFALVTACAYIYDVVIGKITKLN